MDKYTKRYVNRNSKKNISSDGVPNGKGGSYPNFNSHMKYELPIGWTPLGPPTDAYRDGWDRVFGKKEPTPIAKIEYSPCDACGEPEFHNIGPGEYTCEKELDS